MIWALEILKISTLIGSLFAKYITFDLKKYGGIIFHDTEKSCKIWRKADLWFGEWYETYSKFSPEHLKVSGLGVWWDPFIQSRNFMRLKFKEELCVMAMKNDAKLEEKFTCCFNSLAVAVVNKVYNVWAKKLQRSYVSWYWRVIQNLKKNLFVVSKMIREIWKIFTRRLSSPKIGTFMGSSYPKWKMYELKTYREVVYHDNEQWCKIRRGIELPFQNWHEKFGKRLQAQAEKQRFHFRKGNNGTKSK